MNLVYPHCKRVDTLDYDWEGYSVIILFSSEDSLASVKRWYVQSDLNPKVVFDMAEVDSFQCHLFADVTQQTRVAEVCLAGPEAFADLSSYLSSASLEEMIQDEPRTIGALFVRQQAK